MRRRRGRCAERHLHVHPFWSSKRDEGLCVSLTDASQAGGPNLPYGIMEDNSFDNTSLDFTIGEVMTTPATHMTGDLSVDADGDVKAGNQRWHLSSNNPAGDADVGSYQLQITKVASEPGHVTTAAGILKTWDIEGTLDATYTPYESTSTGEVMVHVEFHDKSFF